MVEAKFLRLKSNGSYARLTEAHNSHPKPAKIEAPSVACVTLFVLLDPSKRVDRAIQPRAFLFERFTVRAERHVVAFQQRLDGLKWQPE